MDLDIYMICNQKINNLFYSSMKIKNTKKIKNIFCAKSSFFILFVNDTLYHIYTKDLNSSFNEINELQNNMVVLGDVDFVYTNIDSNKYIVKYKNNEFKYFYKKLKENVYKRNSINYNFLSFLCPIKYVRIFKNIVIILFNNNKIIILHDNIEIIKLDYFKKININYCSNIKYDIDNKNSCFNIIFDCYGNNNKYVVDCKINKCYDIIINTNILIYNNILDEIHSIKTNKIYFVKYNESIKNENINIYYKDNINDDIKKPLNILQ